MGADEAGRGAARDRERRERRGGLERLPRFAFEDEDFLWLYRPGLDGIEESDWASEHAIVNLMFSERFKPFNLEADGAPHPFNLD